jgi:ATP synthase F1 delta subunit
VAQGIRKNSKRYARMLFNTAGPEKAEKVIHDLTAVEQLIEDSREMKNFFYSPMVQEEERKKGIDVLREKLGLGEEVAKFLVFVSQKRAVGALSDILRHFISLYYERKKKAKAVVVTPYRFNGDFEQRIVKSLSRLTGRDIDLEYQVDPELIGGMMVKIGSSMYDASIKGQLTRLREELSKRY